MNTLKIQFNKTLKGLIALLITSVMLIQAGIAQTVTYYHNDALGSPVAASNESGNLLWRESYRPYGSRLRGEDGGTNNVWYTGKQEDGGAGLSYFGARWYDPQLGRFTGIDPVGFKEGNIHSFNRYAYANNNPYKYIDPDGREGLAIYTDVNENPEVGRGTIITAAGISAVVTVPYLIATTTGRLFLAGMELADLADGEIGPPNIPKYARNKYKRLSDKQRQEVLEKDTICVYCEKKSSDTVDHVRSQKQDWAEGAWQDTKKVRSERVNDPSNLAGACKSCNSSKGSKKLGTDWTAPKDK